MQKTDSPAFKHYWRRNQENWCFLMAVISQKLRRRAYLTLKRENLCKIKKWLPSSTSYWTRTSISQHARSLDATLPSEPSRLLPVAKSEAPFYLNIRSGN